MYKKSLNTKESLQKILAEILTFPTAGPGRETRSRGKKWDTISIKSHERVKLVKYTLKKHGSKAEKTKYSSKEAKKVHRKLDFSSSNEDKKKSCTSKIGEYYPWKETKYK